MWKRIKPEIKKVGLYKVLSGDQDADKKLAEKSLCKSISFWDYLMLGAFKSWFQQFKRLGFSNITSLKLTEKMYYSLKEKFFEGPEWVDIIVDDVVGGSDGSRKFKKYIHNGYRMFYAYCQGHSKYGRIDHYVFVK